MTKHAQQRWAERGEGSLPARLKAALPFGGQYGEGLLLLDGDMVFATRRVPAHRRCVLTCLTRDQALVSMQARGAHWASTVPIPVSNGVPAPKAKQSVIEDADRLLASMLDLATRTDEDVAAIQIEALSIRQDMLGRDTNGKIKQLRAALPVLQAEIGRRNSLAKYIRHGSAQDDEVSAMKLAIRELLSEEQQRAVYARKDELRGMPKADWPKYPNRRLAARTEGATHA